MTMSSLRTLSGVPDGLLTARAADLADLLGGPTLIHLPGRRSEPLFVSVLLHGNEDVGLRAVQQLLEAHATHELPRALSIFVGNVLAAQRGVRRLDWQPDFNRVWPGSEVQETPEHGLMRGIVEDMRQRRPYASVDLHNNTGRNPHYACVNSLAAPHLRLAALFSRTIVHFQRPRGVQSMAFTPFCPAVTCECGKVGDANAVLHGADFLRTCLHLAELPAGPPPPGDMHLFHTVATIKVSPDIKFSFSSANTDLQFRDDLEELNFQELEAGCILGRRRTGAPAGVEIVDQEGHDVTAEFVETEGDSVSLRKATIPAMLTCQESIIRQDCLGYFMERYPALDVARDIGMS
jgi:succinylglutamate desuccinylase